MVHPKKGSKGSIFQLHVICPSSEVDGHQPRCRRGTESKAWHLAPSGDNNLLKMIQNVCGSRGISHLGVQPFFLHVTWPPPNSSASNPPSQDMATRSKMDWEDLKSVPCIIFEASCSGGGKWFLQRDNKQTKKWVWCEFVDQIFGQRSKTLANDQQKSPPRWWHFGRPRASAPHFLVFVFLKPSTQLIAQMSWSSLLLKILEEARQKAEDLRPKLPHEGKVVNQWISAVIPPWGAPSTGAISGSL